MTGLVDAWHLYPCRLMAKFDTTSLCQSDSDSGSEVQWFDRVKGITYKKD